MRDDVLQALAIGPDATMEQRTIDITTTGRTSQLPRRIEICFYRLDGETYLSGLPTSRPRDWLRNLEADPHLNVHLKHGVSATLAATATVITDPTERRRILTVFVEQYNERRDPNGEWPVGDVDEWLANSPLAKVTFDEE